MIEPVHHRLPREEFDYQTPLDVLKEYSRPRDKITDLIRKKIIIRVKKGLYILGDGYRRRPYSREILQEIALLGLWRRKFFEKAAFYGDTALRILYGLDRFSEDLDFSLLLPMDDFDFSDYTDALQKEIAAFGFEVHVENRPKSSRSAIQSAFMKANAINQLLIGNTPSDLVKTLHREQKIKIRLEADTDPPTGFDTETRFLLQPIPFAVRMYVLPDLFSGMLRIEFGWLKKCPRLPPQRFLTRKSVYNIVHVQKNDGEAGKDLCGRKCCMCARAGIGFV